MQLHYIIYIILIYFLTTVGIYMGEKVTHFCMELKDLNSTLSQVMDEEILEENNHEYGCQLCTYKMG